MSTLFLNGVAAEDTWVFIDGEQPAPDAEDVVVSLATFKANEHQLLTRNAGRLGVHLEAGEQVDEIVNHLDALALVSLDFPNYGDGRGFSKARLLRDRHGFEKEVRAVGDVRIDQVQQMVRSGCDALQISHQPTIDSLNENIDPGLKLHYQPAVGDVPSSNGRSWARRAS